MIKDTILTQRETEVITKKLSNQKINQQDSNYLSKYVRPKLKKIALMDAESLLKRLEYRQKTASIENKIKNIILKQIKDVEAIIIYGSAIQSNYSAYNDIDILILTKKKIWKTSGEKYKRISSLIEIAKKQNLSLDIQIIDKKSLVTQYPHNPSLIYQLKDHKLIYGKLNLPNKIEFSKLDLLMKLDWSDIVDENSESNEIYHAIRNTILVRLLLNKLIDNSLLHQKVVEQLGINLLIDLKDNTASKTEKKIALSYLKKLNELTLQDIKNSKWEKITLSNH